MYWKGLRPHCVPSVNKRQTGAQWARLGSRAGGAPIPWFRQGKPGSAKPTGVHVTGPAQGRSSCPPSNFPFGRTGPRKVCLGAAPAWVCAHHSTLLGDPSDHFQNLPLEDTGPSTENRPIRPSIDWTQLASCALRGVKSARPDSRFQGLVATAIAAVSQLQV